MRKIKKYTSIKSRLFQLYTFEAFTVIRHKFLKNVLKLVTHLFYCILKNICKHAKLIPYNLYYFQI